MNTLSWLFYGADVFNNLGTFLAVIGSFGTLGSLGGFIFGVVAEANNKSYGPEDRDFQQALSIRKFSFKALLCFLSVWTISMLIPDKQTVYMIAASEMGEEVATTPEFAKVRKLVNEYLDEQLDNNEENAS